MVQLNRILCPVDFSSFSERALIYAMRMAQWYGATLDVVHVMPPLPPSATSELAATSRDLTAKNLRSLVERHRLPKVSVATELIESSEPAAQIRRFADSFNVDLVVTGSHGRSGVQRALLGSVVESLLHTCARPVLIVPSHLDPHAIAAMSFGRIVCAVDFAAASLDALAFALSIAEEVDGALTLLHVIEMPPELARPPISPDYDVSRVRAEAEAAALARLRELVPAQAREYCSIQTAVLEGGAARQILRIAEEQDANLIVLGVHGRNAFDLAFFGSNSKDVIRHAHCPVLIVPAAKRESLRAAS